MDRYNGRKEQSSDDEILDSIAGIYGVLNLGNFSEASIKVLETHLATILSNLNASKNVIFRKYSKQIIAIFRRLHKLKDSPEASSLYKGKVFEQLVEFTKYYRNLPIENMTEPHSPES